MIKMYKVVYKGLDTGYITSKEYTQLRKTLNAIGGKDLRIKDIELRPIQSVCA